MVNNPCKDCNKRTPECHGKCEAYADWFKQNKLQRARINHQKYIENLSRRPYKK